MGEASRKKAAGYVPEPRTKRLPRRARLDLLSVGYGDVSAVSQIMTKLMLQGQSGATYAIRSEAARQNREREGAENAKN